MLRDGQKELSVIPRGGPMLTDTNIYMSDSVLKIYIFFLSTLMLDVDRITYIVFEKY